jgi:hypothetical protein
VYQPHSVPAIVALLFCFAIVLTSPHVQFRKSSNAQSSTTAAKEGWTGESGFAAVELRDVAIRSTIADAKPSNASDAYEPADRGSRPTGIPLPEPSALQTVIQGASVQTPGRSLLEHDHAKEVQEKLIQLGYLSTTATGVWGEAIAQGTNSVQVGSWLISMMSGMMQPSANC